MNPLNWLSNGYRKAAGALVSTGMASYADAEEQKRVASQELGKAVSSSDKAMGYVDNPYALFQTKTLEIVDTMMLDETVGSNIDIKKTAALSTKGAAVPADDEDDSVEHAELVNFAFERLPGTLSAALFDILSAVEYGYSATNRPFEYMPDGPFAGKIGLMALKTKSPHSVDFDLDDFQNILPDGIVFTDADHNEERLPLDQFIVYTYRMRLSDPYGYSDCLRAFAPWNSKRWMMKMWDIYGERYAMGTLVAKYKSDPNPPEQEHTVVQKFGNDVQARSFIKVSDAWELELLEASGKGTDFYEKTIAQRNMAISRAMFIPDQLGFSDTTGGSFAKAQTHLNVFLWPLESLRRDMSETIIEEQIIKPLIDLNYGPQEKYPKYVFDPLTNEMKAQFLSAVFTGIEKGALTPDLDIENRVRQMLEITEKEEDEEAKAGGSPPAQRKTNTEPDNIPGGEIVEDGEPPTENAAHSSRLDTAIQAANEQIGSMAQFIEGARDALFDLPEASPTRKPTEYEAKVNVEQMATVTNELTDQFVGLWADYFRKQRKQVIDYTRKKDIVADKDYAATSNLKLTNVQDARKVLQRYLQSGVDYGALEAQQEIKRAKARDFSLFMREDYQVVDLAKLPLDEIDKFFADQGLQITSLTKQAARAARIEGAETTSAVVDDILAKSKNIIRKGIRRGDQIWTEKQLKKLFDGYIESGQITDNKLGTTYRVETIARNQFTTALNGGRKATFEDPEVEDFVEAYQWSAVLDNSTTDYCATLDKRALAKEDVNSIGWPPAHHNCRSIIVPITQGETYKLQSVPSTISRGPGFSLCLEHGNHVHACGCG